MRRTTGQRQKRIATSMRAAQRVVRETLPDRRAYKTRLLQFRGSSRGRGDGQANSKGVNNDQLTHDAVG
jgi:hypothetical protein